ncbi:MAG: DNA-processing protein DprA [Chloroflexota bacterium]|nr:DNA-processing protein DprA [Chloroflexota bacterium]
MTTRRDDRSLAALLLTDRLVDGEAEPLSPGEFWSLLDRIDDPSRLLGLDAEATAERIAGTKLGAERIQRLLGRATALAFELERRERSGLHVLSPFDEGYPARLRDRLGAAAPAVLYAVGSLELMQQDGLGIVGSRDVSPAGAEAARTAATAAAERSLPVVSGRAKGVDQIAMSAAIEAGGTVVGILADSLDRRLKDPDMRRAVSEGSVCLVTPYKPDLGFSVANAMGRNKLIYALSQVTLVVASDLGRGGTWEGATEALRRGYGAVAVWSGEGAGPGNDALVERGGSPIRAIQEIFDAWADMASEAANFEQLRLA